MDKIFIGNVRRKDFETWGYDQISFNSEDIEKLQQYQNEKGYVNLQLKVSQNGTKYLEVDTYGLNLGQAPEPPVMNNAPVDTSDIPF